MNAHTISGIETLETTTSSHSVAPRTDSSRTYSFCGKGLHYDWRTVVAAVEAADLDAELAHLGVPAAHS